jgi:two-component system phosphate regulon sensor histidine kinase PhoR
VLRVGLPARGLDEAFFPAWRALLVGGAALVLVTIGLVVVASRAVGRPVAQFEAAAARIAAGDFSRRLAMPRWREMAGLAGALNDMASQLDERMKTITRQANEQEAVLSSMTEGVIALDAGGRIASLNEAACRMIGTPREQATGRRLQEVVRNADLERLLDEVLGRGEGAADEVVLQEEGERFVQVHCTVLRDAHGSGVGAVVVLNDLTRLRHLEAVRRDFVANVSHELKTPVTSIKGFVETLRDGALREPENAARFLDIIGRQAERLSAIIDDLLSLSRLEQEGRGKEIALERVDVRELLESAAQVCESKASVKATPLRLTCEAGLKAPVNAPLLEQALVNLIDNAIKHSGPGSPVTVEASRSGSDLVIDVVDHGCGIEPEHLPRLFERFYRVDRARSRSEGGTGLGLAIVKHIAQAHGGTASVTSRPGEGSTFRMTLPLGP